MPKGTPITIKCPKCKLGKYGHGSIRQGCRATGLIEKGQRWNNGSGHGSGGPGFHGHRGLMECLDCGYRWFSTMSGSGRVRSLDLEEGNVPKELLRFASEADVEKRVAYCRNREHYAEPRPCKRCAAQEPAMVDPDYET